jgi:hypothetical protein
MVVLKASAVTGPTPGIVMKRRQSSSFFTTRSSARCSRFSSRRNTSRAVSSASMQRTSTGRSATSCAERFIRTLKENLLWVRTFRTVEELRLALIDFRRTYNERWLIERPGHRSPAQFRHDALGRIGHPIRQAFNQPDRRAAVGTWRHVADQLHDRWPKLVDLMEESETDVLAYMSFPTEHRTKRPARPRPAYRAVRGCRRTAVAVPGRGVSDRFGRR